MKGSIIAMVVLVVLTASCSRDRQGSYTVMKGTFRQTFTETGELEAISAAPLVMPRISYEYGYEFKLIGLAEHGKMVKTGDTVIRIDPSSIQKFIITKGETLDSEKAAAKKQMVQMDNNIQELRAQLRTEQAMFDLKKLELERSRFETDNKRKIKDLEFKQATIRLNKVRRNLENTPALNGYDRKVQLIKIAQLEAELDGAREIIERLSITSPKDGLFQVGSSMFDYPPKNIKVGDRVYTGSLIARIPDIFHMKVRTFVAETDITKISPGMKVIVRLDALPKVPFNGVITEISRVCTLRDKKKIFKVVVEVVESDLRLKPGMTVSCEYICSEVEDALYIPNNCLLRENGKSYIFLKKGGSPKKTEVNAGPSNSHHTLIYGDFEPGQALLPYEQVTNPTRH